MSKNLAAITYLASPREKGVEICDSGKIIPRIKLLKESIRSVEKYFNYNFPIIIFHEDYNEEDKKFITSDFPDFNISFQRVDFSIPSHIKDFADERILKLNSGYAMMCRFFCGVMQRHEALDNYEYYVRLDDDSFFIDPKPPNNIVEELKGLGGKYLYRSSYTENHGYEKTMEILEGGMGGFPADYFSNEVMRSEMMFRKMIYNNFHISSISWWRSKELIDLFSEMERWIFKHEVWDSNIHTLLCAKLLKRDEVFLSKDWAYGHNQHYFKYNHMGCGEDGPPLFLKLYKDL
jgi:hypothetical protein